MTRSSVGWVITLALSLSPLTTLAQTDDEPGIGGRRPQPAPRPAAPTPVPAPPPAGPEAVPPSPTSLPALAEILARARATCRPGAACPALPELVPLLLTVDGGPAAAQLLGESGDERAVGPLAIAASYGPRSLRPLALRALTALGRKTSAHAALLRVARSDPDGSLRRVATEAMTGNPEGYVPPELDVVRPPPLPSAPRPSGIDPDTTRLIYGPTAYRRPRHTWAWAITNLGLWNLDVGITDKLQASMTTIPPVLAVGFLPQLRVGGALSEQVSLALQVGGGVFYPYFANDHDWRVGVYGGGLILTVGSPRLLFNASVQAYGVTIAESRNLYSKLYPYTKTTETRYEHHWVLAPSLGVSGQVGRRVKLNLELYCPLGDHDLNGRVWAILYGIRIFGERIFGDVSFIIPAYPGADEVLQYAPIGFPLLTFGFLW